MICRQRVLRPSPQSSIEHLLVAVNNALDNLDEYPLGPLVERRYEQSIVYRWKRPQEDEPTVRLVIEHDVPAQYVTISADDDESLRALEGYLAQELDLMSVDELMAEASDRERGQPGSLLRLAFGLNKKSVHDEALEIFIDALEDEDRDMRLCAGKGIALLGWAAFLAPLGQARDKEPDQQVRRILEYAALRCAPDTSS